MAIYLCYGCDEYKDSDDGCYESMLAKIKETGEHQFEDCCEDCHEAEIGEKIMSKPTPCGLGCRYNPPFINSHDQCNCHK